MLFSFVLRAPILIALVGNATLLVVTISLFVATVNLGKRKPKT